MYRNGGAPLAKDESSLTDGSESDSALDASPDDALVSAAHFDVLAEVITKLTAHRPSIDGLSNQRLMDASMFIDYEKIDVVEREEHDIENMHTGMDDDEEKKGGEEQADTLQA